MKKIISFLCGLFLMTQTAFGATDPAVEFVNKLTDDVITNVLASPAPMTEKLTLFREKFQSALDLKYIGQFVLGVYWRTADQAQRDAFLKAFMDFTTKSWADKFNMYTGQKIVFQGSQKAQKGQVFVISTVQNNPPADVKWRLREKDGQYKIVDIIVEGVSMAMSYRNEYAAFLQSNNGDLNKLTQTLNEKSAAFKFADEKK